MLRFEEPLAPIECDDANEAIRLNTRAYNAALERLILAPAGAVVLGAPALEDRRAQVARHRAEARVTGAPLGRGTARSLPSPVL